MIAVTGALGFIGSAFVWELNQHGFTNIVCVDAVEIDQRPKPLINRKYINFLNHKEFLQQLKNGAIKLDWIVHMGACSNTTEKNAAYLKEVNLDYSIEIFSLARSLGINLIYASSAAVYGLGEFGYSEGSSSERFAPLNLYGHSKKDFDVWVEQQNEAPPNWYGLRFFNVYGPNEAHKQDMRSLVCKAYDQINSSGKLRLFKSNHPDFRDGEQKRDFIYIKDVTRWMFQLMHPRQGKFAASGIYNMGSGKARTWIDLARSCFLNMNKEMQIDWIDIPANISSQYQNFTQADMAKWHGAGLSAPEYSLEGGITNYLKGHLLLGAQYL